MGLFGKKDNAVPKKNEGGFMDAIRCDEREFLIWKWRPAGEEAGTTKKENALRTGSSVSVHPGQVAIFQYSSKESGGGYDVLTGPYNDTIKTQNFPVLSKIIGLAFAGGTPFQAEIYYINMAGVIQVPFAVPYFDVFDPRVPDLPVQMAVRGSFAFGIPDCNSFIALHSLANFDLEEFKKQIKDALVKYVKAVVTNIPDGSYGGAPIPIVQMERKILQVNDLVQQYTEPKLRDVFGVTLKTFDISVLDIDKTCDGYEKIKKLTADYAVNSTLTQQNINLTNLTDMNQMQMDAMKENQRIQMENMKETLKINREEGQYAQRQATDVNAYAQKLAAEQQNIGAFGIKNQTQVGIAGAEALGKMGAAGSINLGGAGSAGGINPGAMMANMAMGQSVGMGVANMMGNAFNGMNGGMAQMPGMQGMPGMASPMGGMQQPPSPPPVGTVYNVAVNGASTGPFSVAQLQAMAASGQLMRESMVWAQGMANWTQAGSVAELAALFAPQVPPVPGSAPVPPVPPPLS